MELLVLVLVLALAFANGANDVPKGIATLTGAGVARPRTALLWGIATTAVGCLLSLQFSKKMTALFSNGIVSARPTPAFAAAVLIGTVAWVALATLRTLPVSTTHALTGALLGAGTLFAAGSVHWDTLLVKVVEPLLISVLVAYVVSVLLALVVRGIAKLAAVPAADALTDDPATTSTPEATAPDLTATEATAAAVTAPEATAPGVTATGVTATGVTATGVTATGVTATGVTATGVTARRASDRVLAVAHWLTSGLTGLARGLNDTPKIVAVGAFALLSGVTPTMVAIGVAAAMALGGYLVGARLVARLGTGVVRMSHTEGFTANLTTAVLVGLGAFQGLPMSTTHVSVGAIAGSAGVDAGRISGRTVRDFAIAWLVTPPFAAAVAAVAYLALK